MFAQKALKTIFLKTVQILLSFSDLQLKMQLFSLIHYRKVTILSSNASLKQSLTILTKLNSNWRGLLQTSIFQILKINNGAYPVS